MHGRISPKRTCNPCGYTKKISSVYHWLLIDDVKRTTLIDGMGLFKVNVVSSTEKLISNVIFAVTTFGNGLAEGHVFSGTPRVIILLNNHLPMGKVTSFKYHSSGPDVPIKLQIWRPTHQNMTLMLVGEVESKTTNAGIERVNI